MSTRACFLHTNRSAEQPLTSDGGEVTFPELGLKPQLLFSPADPVDEVALIPGLRHAMRARGMFGYFTSGALSQLAPGLAEYLMRGSAPLTLIVSPEVHERDYEAVEQGSGDPGTLANERLEQLLLDRDALISELARHAAECLAWLLKSGRLRVLVAFPHRARFHPKIWEFTDVEGHRLVVRGSGNATASGMSSNVEQMDIDVSWDPSSATKLDRTVTELDGLEAGTSGLVAAVVPLAEAIKKGWIETWGNGAPPTPLQYERLAKAAPVAREDHGEAFTSRDRGFVIPDWLEYEKGQFAHQGEAVAAWEAAGGRGILQMATGAGKTIAALIGARRLLDRTGRLLVVVSAPTRPLVRQWTEECALFGLNAHDTTAARSRGDRFEVVARAVRGVTVGASRVACLVVTNNMLTDPAFKALIDGVECPVLLIGDEVHTLGTQRFLADSPSGVPYRLGLSATPVRQYDSDGTARLLDYFGAVVYEFGLDRAIGNCLVPYEYYVHPVRLRDDEGEEFSTLSLKISQLLAKERHSGLSPEEDAVLKRLMIRRRRIVEIAAEKLPMLERVVQRRRPRTMSHTLFYASAKEPEQLVEINRMLDRLGVTYHQVTQLESGKAEFLQGVLAAFEGGDLQALTAKKVLDEGLNIPQITTAYILASTTVEREWVQRRGRILRLSKATGKTKAVLHDFLVLPPDGLSDSATLSILRGELARIKEFGRLALNATAEDGALAVANRLILDYLPDGGNDGSEPDAADLSDRD